MSDQYRTLAAPSEFRQKIERSDFLGLAFPCASDEEFFDALKQIEKQHFDATHHCWAFRLFPNRPRSSDAGEPSGTAGKPILSAIEGADLFDAAVIVVRWFGGKTRDRRVGARLS
jgi:putative IMPACT (imprinted ancient) family translation regulator